MRIIPVLDLARGKVVHAVAGKRSSYKPVKSVLTSDSDPLRVAIAFRSLGLDELYIADLDAIRAIGNNLEPIGRIVEKTGMEVMVDAGFRRAEDIGAHVEEGVEKIVLATETLNSFEEISKAIDAYGISVVGSIDMRSGKVVARSRSMRLPLPKLARRFEAEGASELILLNLDRVGTSKGPDYASLEKASSGCSVPLLVGGGIRGVEDIALLGDKGAAGVLVATALHEGVISKKEFDQMRGRAKN